MKEKPIIQFLWLLLVVSTSFFMLGVSVSASSVANNQVIIYSGQTAYYTVDVTNDNYIFLSQGGQRKWSQKIDRQIGSVAISPDGEYIAVGCDGGVIYLYDTYWSVQLLWKRTFGDALIRSISFQENGNFIDATNVLNQAFLITRTGNLVHGPITPAITPVSAATLSTIPKTSAPTDFFVWIQWILLALFILFVVLAIYSNRSKKSPKITYPPPPPPPPPQNGSIYAESIPSGAKIYIDGTYVGISPVTIRNVWPRGHSLKATLNGYESHLQRITINPGQTALYSPNLKISSPPPPKPISKPIVSPSPKPTLSFQDLITQLGAKTQQDREEVQKQLIIKVNTEGKPAIQQIIKELESQPSGVKREIVNLLYYLSKESHEGQKVTEELINALTYSSPEVKWLIIQTLGRLKDKRALAALEAAISDTDFLVKYWAIISLKNIQAS